MKSDTTAFYHSFSEVSASDYPVRNANTITYLARYAYRTAINNNRIESVSEDSVSFRYKDYPDNHTSKIKTVSGAEFIALFLQHILPRRFSRVRFSGFLNDWNIGTELAGLSDRFWNFERLTTYYPELSPADAISIICAFVKLSQCISIMEEAW